MGASNGWNWLTIRTSEKLFWKYGCICGFLSWPRIYEPSSQLPASQARHCYMFTSQATNWTLTRTETCIKSMCQESPIDKTRKLTIYPIWNSTTSNGISRDSASVFFQRALGTAKSHAATGYVRNNILLNQTQLQELSDTPYSNTALHKQIAFLYFI
jgi:hypothetical protein